MVETHKCARWYNKWNMVPAQYFKTGFNEMKAVHLIPFFIDLYIFS